MAFAPLVAPADALPADERERAARQLRLPEIGDLGQRRLRAARVIVIGAGGLGSPVLQYLASAGVGVIGIVDDDVVDASNLQCQVLFATTDIGRPKAEVAAERVQSLSPNTQVVRHDERLASGNAERLLRGYDLVIDGTDTFETRYDVADAADRLGLPLVWGSVLRFDAQATVFWSRPSSGQPLRLRDVFPTAPPPDEVPSCAEAGVLGALCGQLGGILAAEAVKLIVGIGEPLVGRMLVIDALSARTREVPLRPAPEPTVIEVGHARVSFDDLDRLAPTLLLDVREPEEFAAGSIPGAVSLPLGELRADPRAVPTDAVIVIYCQLGPRARLAADALHTEHPAADIRLLDGGYAAWQRRHRSTVGSDA